MSLQLEKCCKPAYVAYETLSRRSASSGFLSGRVFATMFTNTAYRTPDLPPASPMGCEDGYELPQMTDAEILQLQELRNISFEMLDDVVRRYPAPQSWYEEDFENPSL